MSYYMFILVYRILVSINSNTLEFLHSVYFKLKSYDLQSKSSWDNYVISIYFTIMTLSTVGYGDFVP
jgi:hypothetical protein